MTDAMLIFQNPTTAQELRSCALFQRKLFELLVTENGLMWDEILFPCADARSVLVSQSLGEQSVFGSHAIIRCTEETALKNTAKKAAELTSCQIPFRFKKLESKPDSIKKAISIFAKGFENLLICADFALLVSGCDENWKIRDASRKFLSFAETANDKTGRSLVGILGGKAVFETAEENSQIISKIYTQKTGSTAKIKIQK